MLNAYDMAGFGRSCDRPYRPQSRLLPHYCHKGNGIGLSERAYSLQMSLRSNIHKIDDIVHKGENATTAEKTANGNIISVSNHPARGATVILWLWTARSSFTDCLFGRYRFS